MTPVRPWPYRFLREEKWRRLDSNLRVRYRVASPSSSPQLGRSSHFFQAFKHPKERRENLGFSVFAIYIAILVHEASAKIGEVLTCASCVAVISGS